MQSFGAAQYPLKQPVQAARQKIQEFKLDTYNHNLLKEIIN